MDPEIQVTRNKNILPAILISVLLSALVAGGGVYLYQKNQTAKTQNSLQAQIDSLKSEVAGSKTVMTSPMPSPTVTPDAMATWKTYTSSQEGLSFKYPADWKVQEDDAVNQKQEAMPMINITSPKREGSPYIFTLNYRFNVVDQEAIKGKPLEVETLDIANSKIPLYLTTFSYASESDPQNAEVSGLWLTDVKPVATDITTKLRFTSQKDGKTPISFEATMNVPHAQNNPGYSLSAYKNQSDYQNIVNIFKSVQY